MPRTIGYSHERNGKYHGRINSCRDFYVCDDDGNETKFGTVARNGELFDLDGRSTGRYLKDLHPIEFF